MTPTTPNTPANGGQILTDERILEIAQIAGKRYDSVNSMTTQATLEIGRAIEADLRALAAVSASVPQQEREAALADRDEVPYLIVFDDHDRQNELVYGGARARYRFKEISASWNAHLFVKIAGNSRDDKTPCYVAAPAPVSGMPDLAKRLNEIDKHLAKCRFTERHAARQLVYSMLHDVCGIPSPRAPDTPVADCGPNPVTWSEEDKHRLDVALNKMYGTPLPAAPAPTEQEAIGVFAIEVEKMLCAALGREWSVCGISIESLIAALAARQAPTDAPKEPTPTCWIDPIELRELESGTVAMVAPIQGSAQRVPLFRQAPDSRDATLEEADQACRQVAWIVANEGDTEQESGANKCRAAVQALKGPAQ